jgi:hypothetical protein
VGAEHATASDKCSATLESSWHGRRSQVTVGGPRQNDHKTQTSSGEDQYTLLCSSRNACTASNSLSRFFSMMMVSRAKKVDLRPLDAVLFGRAPPL